MPSNWSTTQRRGLVALTFLLGAVVAAEAAPPALGACQTACLNEYHACQQSCSGCTICPFGVGGKSEAPQSERLPYCPECDQQYQACLAACPSDPPPDPSGAPTTTVLSEGTDWQLVNQTGYLLDEGGQFYNRNAYMIQSAQGALEAPIPPSIQADLAEGMAGEESFISVDQQIVTEIAQAEQQGYLTPFLESIAEPLDPSPEPSGPEQLFATCSDKIITKSKTFNLAQPITLAQGTFGGGFSGSLSLAGNAQGAATGEVLIRIKRFRLLWACIPYGVRYGHVRAYGNVLVNYGATLSGTLNYSSPAWEWELARPHLASFSFAVGPIPVYIGVNLPITAGLEFSGSVTGSVTYNTGQTAQGPFDYLCTLNGCSGWSNIVQTGTPTPQTITGSVSGRIKPKVHVGVALRAYLYREWFAYAQVGVQPHFYGDLWGFYGNNCGDADGDGWFETVDALTFDLDWQLKVVAQACLFCFDKDDANPYDKKAKRWTVYSSPTWHIGFWDLIGSDAITPMLGATASVPVNTSQRYDSKMRPCWPYGDNVNYRLNWGDGTNVNFSGSPTTFVSNYRTWTTIGAKNISLDALNDAHGRNLNKITARTIQVTNASGTWTAWLNRDAPSGTGDWETLVDFRAAGHNICGASTPIGIECRTTPGGVDYRNAGEVYSCQPSVGGICQNIQQPDGTCFDYEVRFLCP